MVVVSVYCTTLKQKLGIAYNTVMRAMGSLQEQGVVTATTEARRDRVFCAKALLDILEEPARLSPAEPPRISAPGS